MNERKRIPHHPFLRNLLLIALAICALLIAAHLAMRVGTRHGARRSVPDLSGVALADAQRIAHRNDLRIVVSDSLYVPSYEGGIVLEQNPRPGVAVKPGRKVYVTVNATTQKRVEVPYVTGYSLRQAKNLLEVAGLEIGELIYRIDMATNNVLEERVGDRIVGPDTLVETEAGTGVTLVVGVDARHAATTVPKLVGFPLKEARSRLWETGLNVGRIRFDERIDALSEKDARVYRQSPGQNSTIPLGTRVDLYLTLDEERVARESEASDREARRREELREEAQQRIVDSVSTLEAVQRAAEAERMRLEAEEQAAEALNIED